MSNDSPRDSSGRFLPRRQWIYNEGGRHFTATVTCRGRNGSWVRLWVGLFYHIFGGSIEIRFPVPARFLDWFYG